MLLALVATLAVVPVFAQTPQTASNASVSGRATALPQEAQAPGPASSTKSREEEQAQPGATHSGPSEPQLVGADIEHDGHGTDAALRKTKTVDPKYDVAQIGSRNIGKGVNFYSLEKEQRLGRELASELEQQARILDDPVVTEYVNRIGQNLVRNSDAKVPFTIKVIEDDEINALALPGGYFYVNTGLILAVDNEAELAGVMAHEIAHVCARHATRNMTKGRIWNLASFPLIVAGGPVGYTVRQVAGLAVPMSFLKFSRDAEREADFLGLEYQYATGYDPSALVQFFEKINTREKPGKQRFVAKLFSTHPMTEDRIRRAQAEIATILPAREQYVVSTSEFDEVKSRLAGVTFRIKNGTDERNVNRPTLRRRTPQSGNSGNSGNSGTHK
jgi:predicted Zn-dependent protease